MKLKNILLALSILFVATACSMGQDGPEEPTPNKPNSEESYVSFNMSVNSGSFSTKAGSNPNGYEVATDYIKDCTVILTKEGTDNILSVVDGVGVTKVEDTQIYKINHNFLLKTGEKYRLTVVVNNKIVMKGYTKLSQVHAAVQTVGEINESGNLIKLGSAVLDLTPYEGWATQEEAVRNLMKDRKGTIPAYTFKVTVYQLAAKIEFEGLDLSEYVGPEITITNLTFKNLSKTITTDLQSTSTVYCSNGTSNAANLYDTKIAGSFKFPNSDFETQSVYTYPHQLTKDNAISVSLTYQVGTNESVTKEFIINRPGKGSAKEAEGDTNYDVDFENKSGHVYVQSGYIYRLQLKASKDLGYVELDLVCYTKDWKNNELSYDF